MPTVVSPAIGVTVWGVDLDFSLAPTSVYMGDTLTGSGILTETDGTTSYAVAGIPVSMILSNPSVTSQVGAGSTDTDGTYTAYYVVDETAVYGTNYFYTSATW